MAIAKKKSAPAPAKKAAAKPAASKAGGIQGALKNMKAAWKKAETREGFSSIPDGIYVARIESAVLTLGGKKNEPSIEYQLTVLSDEAAGKKTKKWARKFDILLVSESLKLKFTKAIGKIVNSVNKQPVYVGDSESVESKMQELMKTIRFRIKKGPWMATSIGLEEQSPEELR